MTVFFVVLTILLVIAIGLVSVGRATAGLAAAPPRSLFDMDEAVEFVAERLPLEVSSQLSYEDVRNVLYWHLDYLATKGVADQRDPFVPVDRPVLADDDEGVAYVLGQAGAAGLEIDDVAVVEVIEAEGAYLEAIGAIGAPVQSCDDAPAPPG